ncbi:flagellar motor switch protein FliN [Candidatus Magnetomorum sp. HK-1]|nr:flagellar motor switch protein FliN [Candidatus Magnetomorum sp. HK-1]
MLSQEELDQLLGGEQSGGGDESLDQNDLDDMFSSPAEEESSDDDGNMSQDDLDALMGGGGGDAGDDDDDGAMSQDDLDAMLGGGGGESGGGDADDDDEIDWGSAFAEAAAGGDSAAAEAITTGQSGMADETDEEEDDEEYEEDEEAQPFIPEDLDIPHIHFILDLPLELTVEIGRTIMNVKTLLQQNQGSVIELNKDADEPVEIFVGKKLMATGEVVVVDDNFGVRIEDVASQADRIRSLATQE